MTDPRGNATVYAYDALSRLASVTQPLRQQVRYAYDDRDRLASRTLARVRAGETESPVVTYAYAPWGPVSAVRHCDRESDADDPNQAVRTVSWGYTSGGLLLDVTDDQIQLGALYTWSYDNVGRVDTVIERYVPGGDRTPPRASRPPGLSAQQNAAYRRPKGRLFRPSSTLGKI